MTGKRKGALTRGREVQGEIMAMMGQARDVTRFEIVIGKGKKVETSEWTIPTCRSQSICYLFPAC